jgi:hypothetical protein
MLKIINVACADISLKKIHFYRYKAPAPSSQASGAAPGEDLTPDYMNILGMIFSMCGLMMRVCIYIYSLCSITYLLMLKFILKKSIQYYIDAGM